LITIIEDTKDLSEIKVEDLQGTLEAHEMKKSERGNGKNDDQALFAKFKNYAEKKEKWKKNKKSKEGGSNNEDKVESSSKNQG
jgi:hypothetical protein